MTYAIVGLVLLVIAGLMLDSHRRRWLAIQNQLPENRDKNQQRAWRNARAEYNRRMQASGMVGVLGLLIGARPLVPESPLAFALYLCALLIGCLWVLMLGIIDAWANMLGVSRTTGDREAARLRLEAEIKRAREKVEREE